MKQKHQRLFKLCILGISLVLSNSCKPSDQTTVAAIAESAHNCDASRLEIGEDKKNRITVDPGSRARVRSSPDVSGQIIGFLSYQDLVSVKWIDANRQFVEIYPTKELTCAQSGIDCQQNPLYISHKFLPPQQYLWVNSGVGRSPI